MNSCRYLAEVSLDGVRKTTRYQEIEVEYYDFNWKNSVKSCPDGRLRSVSMKLIICLGRSFNKKRDFIDWMTLILVCLMPQRIRNLS